MKTPRIIHVTAYYPPHLGGQEIVVQDLVTQLALAGEQVEVVTSSVGARTGVSVENGVLVTRLKSHEFAHTPIIWRLVFLAAKAHEAEHNCSFACRPVLYARSGLASCQDQAFRYILHLHC